MTTMSDDNRQLPLVVCSAPSKDLAFYSCRLALTPRSEPLRRFLVNVRVV